SAISSVRSLRASAALSQRRWSSQPTASLWRELRRVSGSLRQSKRICASASLARRNVTLGISQVRFRTRSASPEAVNNCCMATPLAQPRLCRGQGDINLSDPSSLTSCGARKYRENRDFCAPLSGLDGSHHVVEGTGFAIAAASLHPSGI